MASRKVVHSIAAILACGWILFSNSIPCVAAPSCDGAIFFRTEGPYKYGQEVSVRVITSPEIHYPDSDVEVFSVSDDDRYRFNANDLGDGVWDVTIRIPLLYNWNRKIGFRIWQGGKIVCEKTKAVDMKADMVMDIKGPEWSCTGYPAEYELTMGAAPSPLSVHWDFGQEERNTMVNTQGRDVQRIRWKTPGEKLVIATIRAQAHPLQSRMITTQVVPKNRSLVVKGPQTVQQGKIEAWTIAVPPIGSQHMTYHMALEVDWGQGETSRFVNRGNWFRISKRFGHPGAYTVGLRLLEGNASALLEDKFIVKVIEDRPTLDLLVTGPQQVTASTPAFWKARTTRGRPPYKFWVKRWDSGKLWTVSSESNVAKFSLYLSTPGKNRLTFQVVDADGIESDWREINVLVTPEKSKTALGNSTQGGNTPTTGNTVKKAPPPDNSQQNGTGSGLTSVGHTTGSPEVYGGLVIKGPAKLPVYASARLQALDHGGRTYVTTIWVNSNTEVLSVSSDGRILGLKPGHATVIVHVGDMQAYHDIEVVEEEGPFNPFLDAVNAPKITPNTNIVVKKPPPGSNQTVKQGSNTGSVNGNSQSGSADDDFDDLDSMTIGGVSVDPEEGPRFNKIEHKNEPGNKGGSGLADVSIDPGTDLNSQFAMPGSISTNQALKNADAMRAEGDKFVSEMRKFNKSIADEQKIQQKAADEFLQSGLKQYSDSIQSLSSNVQHLSNGQSGNQQPQSSIQIPGPKWHPLDGWGESRAGDSIPECLDNEVDQMNKCNSVSKYLSEMESAPWSQGIQRAYQYKMKCCGSRWTNDVNPGEGGNTTQVTESDNDSTPIPLEKKSRDACQKEICPMCGKGGISLGGVEYDNEPCNRCLKANESKIKACMEGR